jgi:hypothetical protein
MLHAIFCRNGHYVSILAETVRARSWHEVQALHLQAMEQSESPEKYNF